MTVMPEHAARLLETSSLLVLDPISGPHPKSVANLALGDEILVQADGKMCFRRLISVFEALAPMSVSRLQSGALAQDVPRIPISVDARQPVGAPLAQALLEPAESFVSQPLPQIGEHWMDVVVEGAARIIVDNLSIGTGPLVAGPSPEQLMRKSVETGSKVSATRQSVEISPAIETETANTQSVEIAPLKVFTGQIELSLLTQVQAESQMVLQFTLPSRTTTLRLISPSAQPPGDSRKLGVAVFRITVDDIEISLDSPALVRGFHRAETGEGLAWRWTDGEALMIMQPKPLPQNLSICITDWHRFLAVDQ